MHKITTYSDKAVYFDEDMASTHRSADEIFISPLH